jgi:hypothetical protein
MFYVMHSKWVPPQNLGISNSERKILSSMGELGPGAMGELGPAP